MLYTPPTGSTDPNAPYVGKNVAAGIQGSKVPPHAVEYPQRELLNIITEAGLSPTNSDLAQVLRAIRGGQLTTIQDSSGAANSIILEPTTAHTALARGLPFRIWPAFANTSTTISVTINSLTCQLKKRNGAALAIGDIAVGVPFDVVSDGTNLRLMDLALSDILNIISSNPTTVQSIVANLLWQGGTQIITPGTSTFTVPAGVTRLWADVWSGGGGGGGAGTSSAGAGCSGAYTGGPVSVTPGQNITVTIGAGGTAGTSGGGKGGNGGTSSFGAYMSCTGGFGGDGASTGFGDATNGTPSQPTGGVIFSSGSPGGSGIQFGTSFVGGAGGTSPGGGGGTSLLSTTSGSLGFAPGGGGGGGASNNAGGAGTAGRVNVRW